MSIILLGDSVLDNFYWLKEREKDLRYRLRELGVPCENYAIDESRLEDIINGMTPADVYSKARSYPYTQDNPISKNDTIVLSVGGNDMRVNMPTLLFGVDQFFKTVLSPKYQKDYRDLIQNLKKKSQKLILVSVYCPCITEGIYSYISFLANPVMNRWFEFINNIAKEFDIPVLDLNRTFNRSDRSHYGSTTIEPSDFSNICIAHSLKYINENYSGYKVYYAPDCDHKNIVEECP